MKLTRKHVGTQQWITFIGIKELCIKPKPKDMYGIILWVHGEYFGFQRLDRFREYSVSLYGKVWRVSDEAPIYWAEGEMSENH